MPLIKREKQSKPPPIPPEVILASRPLKNPAIAWEKTEKGEVVIRIPLETSQSGLFSGFVKEPREKKILLDPIGSYVWELIDGEKTINEIAELVAQRFKFHRREAQMSLLAYIQILAERGLITLLAPAPTSR
ncbi:MAG: PqqD family protein [Thermofilaceae archaeon]